MIKPIEELDQTEGKGSAAYADYYNALRRILADDPEDEELDQFRDTDGRVRATIMNVATLAGRKPQRLMGKDTPFPKLATYILSLKSEFGVKKTTSDRLKRQAEDIVMLVQRLKAVRSRLAESIIVRDDLTGRLETAREDLERARSKRATVKMATASRTR